MSISKQNLKTAVVVAFFAAVVFWTAYTGNTDMETAVKSDARALTLVLWSILLEALPFVLLGTLISSLIQLYVSEDTMLKVLPKNKYAQLVFAALLGLVFPVCECAIIPITRGLIRKGLPVGPAAAFMVAVPIVNPIVIFSTYSAFPAAPLMAVLRPVLGFAAALTIGFFMGGTDRKKVLKEAAVSSSCCCDGHSHDGACGHSHAPQKGGAAAIVRVLAHTSDELKSVGAYLIFGAAIAASMQVFVPRETLMQISGGNAGSILVMMLLSFVLSLCSEADAFVASTFMTSFSGASVLAFLITGPMIDIKNTMMLFGSFKKRFVLKLIAVILAVCFLLSLIISLLGVI